MNWPVESTLRLLVRTNLRGSWRRLLAVREQSRLMVLLISVFLLGYLAFSYGLFRVGLGFISRFPGLGPLLVERLLFLLFAFLFALLLLSNLVIAYTNLFRNRETQFLLTAPVPVQTVFRWKCLESMVLASWAFLFLIAPLLVAYGQVSRVAWHFYPAVAVLVSLFIVLPGLLGATGAIWLARFLDRRRFQVLVVVVFVVGLGTLWWRLRPAPEVDDAADVRVLAVVDRLLNNTSLAHAPWLPSYWLSASVQNWAEGAMSTAGFFALVLLSHVLFFGLLVFTQTGDAFATAADLVQSRGGLLSRWRGWRRRQGRGGTTDRFPPDGLDRMLSWCGLQPATRAHVTKDLRLFFRDTTQWAQTALLFGLLAVYILNLRQFTRRMDAPFWLNAVSYLNLGACALNVATISTRFVFPQFSLEGRRVWLVGLAPLGLPRVLALKYRLAAGLALFLALPLLVLSTRLLQLSWSRTVFFAAAITIMTFTLNALATGLGALYPNFRETNPSKIVSGFGGTLTLILSFGYILGSVVLLAVGSPWGWRGQAEFMWGRALLAWTGFGLLSAVVGMVPYRLGQREVARLEL